MNSDDFFEKQAVLLRLNTLWKNGLIELHQISDNAILSEFWYKYSDDHSKPEIIESLKKINPKIKKFNSGKSTPTSKITFENTPKSKKEYSMHRTDEGNLVLKVKFKNKKNKFLSKNNSKITENVTVMDKYIDQYLISECIPSKTEEGTLSQFYVINRVGKIKSKFGWNGRVKVKFRIKNENGDVNTDMFIMKFKGGKFGILKLGKNVFIKKFNIVEYDEISDFEFRKRLVFVMGYKSPKHGLILFIKFKKFSEGKNSNRETLKIHQIKNLKKNFERDFEEDSGVSSKFLDNNQFQVIEFCFDRVLVHIYDQLLIYEINENFELLLLKNVRHFGSGFCGSAFFFNENVILLPFPRYICKYYIEENKMERMMIAKSLGKNIFSSKIYLKYFLGFKQKYSFNQKYKHLMAQNLHNKTADIRTFTFN